MRLDERQLARKLEQMKAPAPPPELLDALKQEIPTDVRVGRVADADRPVPSPWVSRRVMAAAASLVLVLGGSMLAWRVVRTAPPLLEATPVPDVAASSPVDRPAMEPAERPLVEAERELDEVKLDDGRAADLRKTVDSSASADQDMVAGVLAESMSALEPAPRAEDSGRRADQSMVASGLSAPLSAAGETPRETRSEPTAQSQDRLGRRSEAASPRLTAPVLATKEQAVGYGNLYGTVIDDNGWTLPGVTVELVVPVGPASRVQISDAQGRFEFVSLPAGSGYTLVATLEGFSIVEWPNLTVLASRNVTVELHLPSAVEETITVTSESPLLDERKITKGTTISSSRLERSQTARTPGKRKRHEPKRFPAQPPPPAPAAAAPPSTGGTAEPNGRPYGDVFFESSGVNPFIDTEDDALSTFGLDVDTGSYGVVRRYLRDGHLPPEAAVRVEELVNAFDYHDAAPESADFALSVEGAPSPWAPGERYYLLRVAVKGREVSRADRRPADLIFVIDVSGSMGREDRLGTVKRSLGLLLDQLDERDRVGLVVYGSRGEVLLEPTGDLEAIRRTIERLVPTGATNAEEGLVLAYELAARSRREGAISRVVLCSDGVANVGRTGPDAILARVGEAARQGIELTTIGFGMGNYNDVLMERLADTGNGRYAYVDSLDEARRIFVEELTGTLQTIAAEARAQVEFDERAVARYRLIGYENRDIADERFRDDTVDAGEIGAGHAVTVLYEVKLRKRVGRRVRLATVHVRYRPAESQRFVEVEREITRRDLAPEWEEGSAAYRLATVVGRFAEILRGAYWARDGDLEALHREARGLADELRGDQRVAELADLVGRASDLSTGAAVDRPPSRD